MSSDTKKAPDPVVDPVGYLLARGWSPEEGSKANAPGTRWIDPEKPKVATEERVKVGEKVLPGNKTEPIFQTRITMPAWPMTRQEAVSMQMERDAATARR